MGLDMYLYRKTYVKNWEHTRPEYRYDVTIKKGGLILGDIKPERIAFIVEEVAYWRKANAIHKWFVDNCQGGKDECQESYVDKSQIQQLVELCKDVLSKIETVEGDVITSWTYTKEGVTKNTKRGLVVAQQDITRRLLPTESGFFFGGTDYDEYYLMQLKETIKMLEPLLSEEGGEFHYRASW